MGYWEIYVDIHPGLCRFIIKMWQWYASLKRQIPQNSLSLSIFNQVIFQNIGADIADPIRTNSSREQLHFFHM